MTTVEQPSLEDEFADIPANELCLLHNVRTHLDIDEDFAESIAVQGILVRCTVQRGPCEHGLPYVMVAGHRRTTALQKAQGPMVPVPCEIVVHAGEAERVIYMISENLQRHDLDPVDEGFAFVQLLGFDMNQALIATSVGKSDAYVSERIAITGLPERAFPMIRTKKLTLEGAVKLARTNNDVIIKSVLDQVAKGTTNGSDLSYEIKRAQEMEQRKTQEQKLLDECKAKGWRCGKGTPEKIKGQLAMIVDLKGTKNFGYERRVKVDMTPATFMKRPDAYARVMSNWTTAYVEFWTTDGEQYQAGGKSEDLTAPAIGSSEEKDAERAVRAEIEEHRKAFAKGLVTSKVPASDITRIYLDVVLGEWLNQYAEDMAALLDVTEDEVIPAVAKLGAAARFKLLLALEVRSEAVRGIFQQYVPDIIVKLGYVPHEHEHGWPSQSERDERQSRPADDEDEDETDPYEDMSPEEIDAIEDELAQAEAAAQVAADERGD